MCVGTIQMGSIETFCLFRYRNHDKSKFIEIFNHNFINWFKYLDKKTRQFLCLKCFNNFRPKYVPGEKMFQYSPFVHYYNIFYNNASNNIISGNIANSIYWPPDCISTSPGTACRCSATQDKRKNISHIVRNTPYKVERGEFLKFLKKGAIRFFPKGGLVN